MRELRFSAEILKAITDQARRDYPEETCGLMIGRLHRDHTHVLRMYPVANTASPDQRHHFYQIEGKDFLAAEQTAREAGLEVVGVFHSHPDQQPVPSKTDRELAWENLSYLIVHVSAGQDMECRSWRLMDGAFQEEMVKI